MSRQTTYGCGCRWTGGVFYMSCPIHRYPLVHVFTFTDPTITAVTFPSSTATAIEKWARKQVDEDANK